MPKCAPCPPTFRRALTAARRVLHLENIRGVGPVTQNGSAVLGAPTAARISVPARLAVAEGGYFSQQLF
jgi:hypothetical protein